ncbi:hypothetical protein SAMN03159488_02921 [Pseudomonas sp. NFIX10]|uniref:hypothetical protein n=1 Tax=unclassified Pseudomonas TaxID=196821 RepID=UPI0008E3F940|nr:MULTISPECIES: hypothetical protein [unclassified Pseudomonas]SFB30572.1 hypothetical protein SAMN03159488_02921 [Pseudomonas sp. NFIX10]SFF64790.1 hypothetical protein SAMN03159367_05802 [Pseudomonas sp. NFACC06-1]
MEQKVPALKSLEETEADQAPEMAFEHAATHKDIGAMEGHKLLESTFSNHPTRLSNLHV